MNNKQLFCGKGENYGRYRPSYPQESVDFLYGETGLTKDSVIADIGSGTGKFTILLLDRGNKVYAVEPNDEMRSFAEKTLKGYENFHSVNAFAENTGLEDQFVDFIVSAQAFHWFDRNAVKKEFKRILKPSGRVILIWNTWFTSATVFTAAYEEFLLNVKKCDSSEHKREREKGFKDFFKDDNYTETVFPYIQMTDFEQLKGLFLSTSYSPLPGDELCESLIGKLGELFEKHKTDGMVSLHYETRIYSGEI